VVQARSVWALSFVWLNQTNQIDQRDPPVLMLYASRAMVAYFSIMLSRSWENSERDGLTAEPVVEYRMCYVF